MERLRVPLAVMLALAAVPAAARQAVSAAPPPPAADTTTDTALELGLSENRMTVPVSIGAAGPWPFVIDTGAERTVVSHELAASLNLAPGPALRVVAMAGVSAAPSVVIPSLKVSTLAPTAPGETITAPAFERRNLGASGILGIDALQGHRVEIDFDRSAMLVRPSHRRRIVAGTHGDEIVVVARSLYGQLIVTDASWRNHKIAVVIDTGSTTTIGNPALLTLMGKRARPLGPTQAVSVTGAVLHADVFAVDNLSIGGIGFTKVPVAIADAAPFRRFGLERRPALMMGMDTLRLFRHVRIDFANRDIEFTLPRQDGVRIGLPGA